MCGKSLCAHCQHHFSAVHAHQVSLTHEKLPTRGGGGGGGRGGGGGGGGGRGGGGGGGGGRGGGGGGGTYSHRYCCI